MPGTGSYKRTTQNQGGGPAKYGTAISLIGIPRLLARVISRRAYGNTSANNELICSTITLFNGIINNLIELDTKLKNKILFTTNLRDIPPINTTTDIKNLNIGGTDGIGLGLTLECLIKQGLILNEKIQIIRIIQGNNDYSVTGTITETELLQRTEYILLIFRNITVITDNGVGDGIYNINDPITIQFSTP